MPAPTRYAEQIPDIVKIWEPEGYFLAQTKIWEAECVARHELYGKPTAKQLKLIKSALKLTAKDIIILREGKGHETNKLLRTVQARLSPETGNFIHLGNTSSDVLDTSLSLQIIESLNILGNDFNQLRKSLKKLALKHRETLQIGRTHGQHAIPQTFGRQVVGWYAEVRRGIERIDHAKKIIAFGKLSGEIGTHVYIEPKLEKLTLIKLGLKPDEAPTQIISRDRHIEVVGLMVTNSATLARIAENIRHLAMAEVGEVREPFEGLAHPGSSAMPHKRNPELSERIIGLDRVIRSKIIEESESAKALLERDISHSSTERYVFPDLFESLTYAVRLTNFIIENLEVFPDKMRENLNMTHGAIYSSRLLNALIESGKYSRTEAYDLVRKLVQKSIDKKTDLKDLALNDPETKKTLKTKEIEALFDPKFYLKNIDVAFERAGIISSK
ncbi:MAG: Adenylosuccinate lyase [Microgenomates group bacterium GW2011_GWA2_37_6]|nr:MAG: Adenylosuccinate lyase [Microgenomates group bacterium GW2011_GWA2_37_6]